MEAALSYQPDSQREIGMDDDILLETTCPNCQQPLALPENDNSATCSACGHVHVLTGHFCPVCGIYHEEETGFCVRCGADMIRVCRHCHTTNWTGRDTCQQCGQSLDIFEYLHIKGTADTTERLNEQMAWSRQIKQKEKEDAEKRMAELMAIEEERQAQLRALKSRQKEEDKKLILLGALGLVVLVLSIIALIAFQALT